MKEERVNLQNIRLPLSLDNYEKINSLILKGEIDLNDLSKELKDAFIKKDDELFKERYFEDW